MCAYRHVVQYPPYKGIPVSGTRDDVVQLPPGFVLAFPLSLGYPVMKGSIHVPLNQIQLSIREQVLSFANVNGGDRKALPPRLGNYAVDTHNVRGIGLFQGPMYIVVCRWPSLGGMGWF